MKDDRALLLGDVATGYGIYGDKRLRVLKVSGIMFDRIHPDRIRKDNSPIPIEEFYVAFIDIEQLKLFSLAIQDMIEAEVA